MNISPLDNEEIVLQKLQGGDQKSFDAIFLHYYPSVLAQVLHLVHSPDLAEDVTQDIFLKIWEYREKLSEIQSFKSYLFITARNRTINILKAAARTHSGMNEIVRHIELSRNNTEEDVQSAEYLRFIQEKLNELPPRSREIFRLCREQSKSYNEVAEELGISRDAVKSRMVHAMRILRNAAKNEMGFNFPVLLFFIIPFY